MQDCKEHMWELHTGMLNSISLLFNYTERYVSYSKPFPASPALNATTQPHA
jgi:hypothetical protein